MKKRVLSLFLALVMAVSLLPLNAQAAGGHIAVRLLGKSGDRLTGYYVRYEINGIEYRSDQAGSAMNRAAWNNMSDADRRTTLNVYAFAPDVRIEQFGADGSKEMTDWINEKQGWKALWEAYADRIEQQQCGPLVQYYADENYDAVLGELQRNAKGEYDSWYSRLQYYSEYPEAQAVFDKYKMIGGLMSTGKSAYGCIVKAYTKAREASAKAISKELISIIVDKTLTPNITVAPTAATTNVYTGIADLFFAVTGYSDELTQKVVGKTQGGMDAVEVVNAMRELAQLNYQLAARCYREAKTLSDSIPAEAEAALEICKAKHESAEMEKAQKEARKYEEEAAKAEQAAKDAERLQSLYDGITSGVPTWTTVPGLTSTEYSQAFKTYREAVDAYLPAAKSRFETAHTALLADCNAWASKYGNALDALAAKYDCTLDGILPGVTLSGTYPVESARIISEGISYTDKQVAEFRDFVSGAQLAWRNNKAVTREYMEEARQLHDEAFAELKELAARDQALSETYMFYHATSYNTFDGTLERIVAENFAYPGTNTGYYRFTDSAAMGAVKKRLNAVISYENEGRIEGLEASAQKIGETMEYMLELRDQHLANIKALMDEYNRYKSNFDLATSWGERQRDAADALLDSLPDYVASYQSGTLIVQTKLGELIAGASDPQAKALELGRSLSAVLDEYEHDLRRIKNAKTAVNYYWRQMNAIYQGIYMYQEGYGLPKLTHWYEEQRAFETYVDRALTADQKHNLAVLRLLVKDLNGWGSENLTFTLKLAELRETKSAAIKKLQGGDEYANRTLISTLRTSLASSYSRYCNYTGFGYARQQAYLKGLTRRYDAYGDYLELVDWIEANYASYVVPTGIGKAGVMLLDDEPDMILAGAGDRGQLKAVVTPDNATDKGVVWESLDPEVIEVDENGVVLAVAEGEGEVRARALDAPAEAVYDGEEIVGYSYGEEYYVTFTVRVDPSAFKGSQAAGSEAYVWRNFGSDSAPRFIKATELDGVTTVAAAYQAEPDQSLLCLALYDADGRLLALSTAVNNGTDNAVAASTEATPARARLFLLNSDMTPAAVPPIDETLER